MLIVRIHHLLSRLANYYSWLPQISQKLSLLKEFSLHTATFNAKFLFPKAFFMVHLALKICIIMLGSGVTDPLLALSSRTGQKSMPLSREDLQKVVSDGKTIKKISGEEVSITRADRKEGKSIYYMPQAPERIEHKTKTIAPKVYNQ